LAQRNLHPRTMGNDREYGTWAISRPCEVCDCLPPGSRMAAVAGRASEAFRGCVTFNTLLTGLQLDALTEIVNIGVNRAAASLREMVGEQVHLSVPKLALVAT
jgi:chemotaxis protein CheY-P-specific phosphatase CheC